MHGSFGGSSLRVQLQDTKRLHLEAVHLTPAGALGCRENGGAKQPSA